MPAEEQVVRAVEILRGTTFDFRVEATADVVALYGLDVLVAALERLDAGIEPGPAQNRPLEQSDAPLPQGREAAQPVATVEEAEQQLKAIEEEPPTALDEEHRTLPGPDQGTRLALQDVQATLGEFLALALPYVEESDMQQLADV